MPMATARWSHAWPSDQLPARVYPEASSASASRTTASASANWGFRRFVILPMAVLHHVLAVLEQVQLRQLLQDALHRRVFEGFADVVEQQLGEALAGAMHQLTNARRSERSAEPLREVIGQVAAGELRLIDPLAHEFVVRLPRVGL